MSALLDDLADRGMLDDTLFVVMGEFGRSPKINAQAGRDHWPGVATVVLAGAGIPSGAVCGASDRLGGLPQSNPVTPADLTATFCICSASRQVSNSTIAPAARTSLRRLAGHGAAGVDANRVLRVYPVSSHGNGAISRTENCFNSALT